MGMFVFVSGTESVRTESEEKVILVSENDLFLTLGLGTSNARNKNLRPLFYRNIPLISGKYGLRNHFWPLESRFLMRKIEKKIDFLRTLFFPDFDPLASNSIYIFVHENKKNYHG